MDATDKEAQEADEPSHKGWLRRGLEKDGDLSTRDGLNHAEVINLARRKSWARLSERERKVTALTFVGENQKTIAQEVGVSRSRISQIRRDVKKIMKNQINTLEEQK